MEGETPISTPAESGQQDPLALTKVQIEELNKILEKGRKIATDIDEYHTLFQELKIKLDDPINGLNANLATTQKIKDAIEAIKQTAQNNLQEITTLISSVQVKVDELNSTYQTFVAAKARIDDPASGLIVTLENSHKLLQEIEGLKTTGTTALAEIQKTNTDIQSKAQEIATAYADFLAIKAKIDDPQTGLEAILAASTDLEQKISAVQKQSNALFEEIKKFRDESQGYTKDIADFRQQAETDVKTISEIEATSEDLKSRIIQSYNVITGTGLANSFDQRKKELEISVASWYNLVFWSTVLLIAALVGIYVTAFLENALGGAVFWYRLTFASPIVFFVIFATERYATERNLLEKYAFKSATAFALESYTTLLKSTFSSEVHEQEILEFVLRSMGTIYKEPFEHKSESHWSFGLKNKLGEIKAEIAGTKEGLQTIKEMLPIQTKTIVQETTKNVAEEIEKAVPTT